MNNKNIDSFEQILVDTYSALDELEESQYYGLYDSISNAMFMMQNIVSYTDNHPNINDKDKQDAKVKVRNLSNYIQLEELGLNPNYNTSYIMYDKYYEMLAKLNLKKRLDMYNSGKISAKQLFNAVDFFINTVKQIDLEPINIAIETSTTEK